MAVLTSAEPSRWSSERRAELELSQVARLVLGYVLYALSGHVASALHNPGRRSALPLAKRCWALLFPSASDRWFLPRQSEGLALLNKSQPVFNRTGRSFFVYCLEEDGGLLKEGDVRLPTGALRACLL